MIRLSIFLVLLLLPQSKSPLDIAAYPVRPVDILMLLMLVTLFKIRLMPNVAGKDEQRLFRAAVLAFVASLLSAAWGVHHLGSTGFSTLSTSNGPISYAAILPQRFGLLAVCFGVLCYVITLKSATNKELLKYWYYGCLVAVALHIFSYLAVNDYLANRGGVFVEGNHGGSYYLLTVFLMWIAARNDWEYGKKGIAVSLIGLFLSQSTASLLIVLILGGIGLISSPTIRRRADKKRLKRIILGLVVAIPIAVTYGPQILVKLTSDEVNSDSFSRLDRLASITGGAEMFMDNPTFGVGLQGYAFVFPDYADEMLTSMGLADARRIANNIYIELLSEQGLIGFAIFFYFMIALVRPAFRHTKVNALVCLGYLSIFLSWMAFPTYAVSFHWVGFALLYRLTASSKYSSTEPQILPNRLPSATAIT